jgi:hypothetical protein
MLFSMNVLIEKGENCMLQLRSTRVRMVLLLSILALFALLTAILILSHGAMNASALSNGVYGGH